MWQSEKAIPHLKTYLHIVADLLFQGPTLALFHPPGAQGQGRIFGYQSILRADFLPC